jgi:hypothetical protein
VENRAAFSTLREPSGNGVHPPINTVASLTPARLLIGLLKSPWAKGHIGAIEVRLFAQAPQRCKRRTSLPRNAPARYLSAP